VILVNLCGHGHFDMSAYEAYLGGELTDLEFSSDDMDAALARLPDAPIPA
jgi:tryptophan synthase beta chain